jgi:hypothetical protein
LRHVLELIPVIFLIACDESPTGPGAPQAFTVSTDRTVIGRSDMASVVYRFVNITGQVVTLSFPSSCAVKLSLTGAGTTVTRTPDACVPSITSRTLAPGESLTTTFRIGGLDALGADVRMPPERYRAVGTLEDGSDRTVSVDLTFT